MRTPMWWCGPTAIHRTGVATTKANGIRVTTGARHKIAMMTGSRAIAYATGTAANTAVDRLTICQAAGPGLPGPVSLYPNVNEPEAGQRSTPTRRWHGEWRRQALHADRACSAARI